MPTTSGSTRMRPRAVVATVSTIPVVVGGYLLFDGMHALLLGRYFGPGIGPWGFPRLARRGRPSLDGGPFRCPGIPLALLPRFGVLPKVVGLVRKGLHRDRDAVVPPPRDGTLAGSGHALGQVQEAAEVLTQWLL